MNGKIVARDDTPTSQEFYFVFNGECGRGSYVRYDHGGQVLARVSRVFRVNEYYENLESISDSIDEDLEENLPVDEWEVSIAKAEVMGRFRGDMVERVNDAPAPGTMVGEADHGLVERFLGLAENGINLGEVQQQGLDAEFDLTDTLQKHFAILAQSGAGKSYTASVMLEELLERENAPAIVAVDPHGDYTCFAEDENYMKKVKVFGDRDISIAAKNLTADQVAMFFTGNFSSVQRQELSQVFSRLKRAENTDFGLGDVIARVEDKEMNDKTKYSLLRKLNQLQSMNVFGRVDAPGPNDLEPGKLNIIDLSDTINHQKKQIITGYFGKRFFRLRREKSIPPFLMLVEEAHNFAPGSRPAPSKSVIEKLAREGRKFHASLGLVSQRPVRLSTTALSQCNTKFILRVTNPNDLEHISQSSEGITAEVKNQIPGLKTGESIVIGEAVNYPTFIDVRERKSRKSSSGDDLENALEEWQQEQQKLDEDAEAFM